MEEIRSDLLVPEEAVTRPRRPKPSWYHYVAGLLGMWVLLVPMMLLTFVDFADGPHMALAIAPLPFIAVGIWWALFRADRFLDEYELAYSRHWESLAFRCLVGVMMAGAFLKYLGWTPEPSSELFMLISASQFGMIVAQWRSNRRRTSEGR